MAEEKVDIFGWDLLYSLYEKHFTKQIHVVVVWTHFTLLRRGFKNVGLGEDQTLPTHKDQREILPVGWHNHAPSRLRYFYNKKLYFLTIQDPDEEGDIIINLNRPCDGQVTVTTMNVTDVQKLNGTLDEIMPDWPIYLERMNEEIIDPLVLNDASKDVNIQTESNDDTPSATTSRPALYRDTSSEIDFHIRPGAFIPPAGGVGSADLDPLGGGGGMLFQPPGMFRPVLPDPSLPRGSIPPGARFDPIMPGRGGMPPLPRGPFRPNPGPRTGYPDPDHLPPPGYDDMFS